MNTPQKGTVRSIVFKDGDTWYAVALEFNIVEASDDKTVALVNLQDAISGYIESIKKMKGARVSPLNQKTDPEYEKLWDLLNAKKPKKTPYEVAYYGMTPISA